ncbi:MAG: hypothetical protein K2X08_05910, partial [Chlamydiales bacterium]|nr:hypothetical protein [Chlamydiales bacterium]
VQAAHRVTEGLLPGSTAQLNAEVLKEISVDMPHVQLSLVEVVGQKYVDLLAKVGLASSKSDAIRLMKNGGTYLNNQKIQDPAHVLSEQDVIDESFVLLRVGKKNYLLISVKKI